MKLLHILGSDIPHHNRTLLAFFAEQVSPHFAEKPQFWVVSQTDFSVEFPELDIQIFASKKAIAKAVIAKNSQDPTACFFFHGQFNPWIWLAILVGKISPKRCVWHIWGADLYENANSLAFRLFYPLRRLAQKRLKTAFGTKGDLDFFGKINPKSHRLLLYFPTKMPNNLLDKRQASPLKAQIPPFSKEGSGEIWQPIIANDLNILLGNSGDPSNLHLVGLEQLHKQLGSTVQLKIPMGYPAKNEGYISQVQQFAEQLFGAEKVDVWHEQQPFAEYLQNLAACDLGYFPFERQQGIGTLCLLILLNVPFALSRKNPFRADLVQAGVPFLDCDELSFEKIAETKQKLQKLDKAKLPFFPENYRQQWLKRLQDLCK